MTLSAPFPGRGKEPRRPRRSHPRTDPPFRPASRSQGPIRSPGSRWAGTGVTNSARGADDPSRPGLWLASRLRPRRSLTPARTPALGARRCAPRASRPAVRPARSCRKKLRRARCHVGTGSLNAAAARAPRAVPGLARPRSVGRRAGAEGRVGGSRRSRPGPRPESGFRSGLSLGRPRLTL